MVRYVLKRKNYRQWDCFVWSDYKERQLLARTFTRRHLPLTTGQEQPDLFKEQLDPKRWDSEPQPSDPKFVPTRKTGAREDEPQNDTVMVFDVEKQMLVPLLP